MLVGRQEKFCPFKARSFLCEHLPTGTRAIPVLSSKFCQRCQYFLWESKTEWVSKRNASHGSLLQLNHECYQQQQVNILMCSDSRCRGGSAFTPNVSFQQSSQPTHKQETDEEHISTWGNSVCQTTVPLKRKKFLIDLVCISISRWRWRSEQLHLSCVSSGNTREHWLLRKMTRKALSIPLQQMGCDNRPEASGQALILHLLPSIIAPQTETKLHPQTEACAPSIKNPLDRTGRKSVSLFTFEFALFSLPTHGWIPGWYTQTNKHSNAPRGNLESSINLLDWGTKNLERTSTDTSRICKHSESKLITQAHSSSILIWKISSSNEWVVSGC